MELATLISVSCVSEHRAQRAKAVSVVWVDTVACCDGRPEGVCDSDNAYGAGDSPDNETAQDIPLT